MTVKYSIIDAEILFSMNPFIDISTVKFGSIKPHVTSHFDLAQDPPPIKNDCFVVDFPREIKGKHCLVNIRVLNSFSTASTFLTCLSCNFHVSFNTAAGLLTVNPRGPTPLPPAYVKVFSKCHDDKVEFYKDGFTDRRNVFDYASISTNQLEKTRRFSVLVCIEGFGAVIEQVDPPKM
ncbi:hypothetical protein RCL1_005648 [Eukaryota sp. TZLM3-RCL]